VGNAVDVEGIAISRQHDCLQHVVHLGVRELSTHQTEAACHAPDVGIDREDLPAQ
jgi:hypothetical protein